MKMTNLKHADNFSNEKNASNNYYDKNLSIIKIGTLTAFVISDECMGKLEYDAYSII
jgi:hypothetical protein